MPTGYPGRVPCTIDGCEKPMTARGWCKTHYERWRQHGDPACRQDLSGRLPVAPLLEHLSPADLTRMNRLRSDLRDGSRWDAIARRFGEARRRGWLSRDQADLFAIRLAGRHPSAIWGDEWFGQ